MRFLKPSQVCEAGADDKNGDEDVHDGELGHLKHSPTIAMGNLKVGGNYRASQTYDQDDRHHKHEHQLLPLGVEVLLIEGDEADDSHEEETQAGREGDKVQGRRADVMREATMVWD